MAFWIGVSFVLWLGVFRVFLSGSIALDQDASNYYEHFKYFIDQICQGTFPLWDPNRAPGEFNELYLRRIGPYNCFYWFIPLFDRLGLSYLHAYLLFLVLYYFLGMVGFYKLAYNLFQNIYAAFAAYLLLMFSSFACLLFNSFIVLLFTPCVWFFYFWFRFSQNPSRFYCMGLTFCLMLIVSTYIPFYALTIFLSFLFWYVVFYASTLKNLLSTYSRFIRVHKACVMMCAMFVAFSLLPGLIFFSEARHGDFVLPLRSGNVASKNPLVVVSQQTNLGGIIPIDLMKDLFSNLQNSQLGVISIPCLIFPFFFLGLIVKLNKRLALLFLWALCVYVIGVYDATPFYKFLYKHVFFFKYFRNFQFFLWLVILPAFILLCMEHFRAFLNMDLSQKKPFKRMLGFIAGMYLFILWYLSRQENVISSIYVVIGLSAVFFGWLCLSRYSKNEFLPTTKQGQLLLLVLLILTVIQPFELYHYVAKNSTTLEELNPAKQYRYDAPYQSFRFIRYSENGHCGQRNEDGALTLVPRPGLTEVRNPPSIYQGTSYYFRLYQNIDQNILENYIDCKLIVYDQAQKIDDHALDFPQFSEALRKKENRVFIAAEDWQEIFSTDRQSLPQFQPILENSEEFQVIDYSMNSLTVKTGFHQDKFLVYTDSYYPGWRVRINKAQGRIVRANVAFKGVWLPAGENTIEFRFGPPWRYWMNFALMILFAGVFVYLCILGLNGISSKKASNGA
jgi:hypothetical protein